MGPNKPKILIIDDERALVNIIQDALTEEGMEVRGAHDADEGMRLLYQFQPNLVVLDIVMPGCDGWEVCQRLRRVTDLPILMLTARSEHTDMLRGLGLGADDYMTKPFSLEVLRARIEALLRRAARSNLVSPPRSYEAGDVRVDMLVRQATLCGRPLRLAPREFDLLAYLVRFAGRTVPHSELLQRVWGPDCAAETQYLTLYIWYLRNHLEENPRRPRRIVTWRGLGYRLMPVSEGEAEQKQPA